MMTRTWLLIVPLVAAGTLAEEMIRRGNAAYERGDYDAATSAYTEAESRITDPGLAAFNKAAALYQKGLYREAESHYRCCLEDAEGLRRIQAWYGLGAALLQQGRERGADVLREAIRCYEECLRQPGITPELADDARHNLELAKLLLPLVPPKSSEKPNDKPEEHEDRPKPPERHEIPDQAGMQQFGKGKADRGAEKKRIGREQSKDAEQGDEGTQGAATELPPVPDQDELAQMSREDAQEHLRRAALRILSEQRAHQKERRMRGSDENGLDW